MLITVEEALSAGVAKHVGLTGRYFRLMESSSPLNIVLTRAGRPQDSLQGVEAGVAHRVPEGDEDFDKIILTSALAQTVKFVVTDGHTSYDRLFVAIAQALTLSLPGNVTVGTSEGAVLAAGSRRKVIFQADSGNAGVIALGPTGVLLTSSPIVLGPGDMWVEEVAASAAWRGIASVATQTLRVLTAM